MKSTAPPSQAPTFFVFSHAGQSAWNFTYYYLDLLIRHHCCGRCCHERWLHHLFLGAVYFCYLLLQVDFMPPLLPFTAKHCLHCRSPALYSLPVSRRETSDTLPVGIPLPHVQQRQLRIKVITSFCFSPRPMQTSHLLLFAGCFCLPLTSSRHNGLSVRS